VALLGDLNCPCQSTFPQRKLTAEKEVLRCDGSPWCEQQHNEAGQVGEYPKDDSSQRNHATIMPQLGEGPATRSVRPRSNICGPQAFCGIALVAWLVRGQPCERAWLHDHGDLSADVLQGAANLGLLACAGPLAHHVVFGGFSVAPTILSHVPFGT
jgi:hypothetical protein